MEGAFQQSRLACASFATIAVAWVLLWLFITSGMNSHPNTWWIEGGAFLSIFSSPAALVLAIIGLFFDRRKRAAVVALLLSLASTLVILSIGG